MPSSSLILLAILGCANALPTPLNTNVDAAVPPPPSASAAAAGLRGPVSLLGYGTGNKLTTENTDAITYKLVPGQTDNANLGTYLDFENTPNPQPIRGTKGGLDPGPRNPAYDQINSDKLAPPGTDHSGTINAQWPLGLSHTKTGTGGAGWSRQENTAVMPAAKKMAGVDMRLEKGAYRELHWHVAGEWALMLNGTVRLNAVDENGRSFVDDVSKGDVWFFPPGVPHSIQAFETGGKKYSSFSKG
jgi:quercetin dioxygenase-like cupin family protein